MKKFITSLLAVVLLATFAGNVFAGDRYYGGRYGGHYSGHRGHYGVYIGVPLIAPWVYRPYYGYYPPTVIRVPETPPVYIERGTSAPPAEAYWHYCGSVGGYYPYVKECPEGWQRVAPQPPPG